MIRINLLPLSLLLIFIILGFQAYSQTSNEEDIYDSINDVFTFRETNMDSMFTIWQQLEKHIDFTQTNTNQAYYNYTGSELYKMKANLSKADSLLKIALKLYTVLEDKMGISMCYLENGNLFMNQMNLDSAQHYYNKSYVIKKELEDKDGISLLWQNLGLIEDYRGNYDNATAYYFDALQLFKELGNRSSESATYHNLSILEYSQGNFEEAIAYQNLAVPINQEINNKYSESMNHVCLSSFYLEIQNLTKAEEHGLLAQKMCTSLNDKRGVLYAWSSLGDVYLKQNKYELSLIYFMKFLNEVDNYGDAYMRAQVEAKVADLSFAQNNYDESIKYLNKSLVAYNKIGSNKELFDANLLLSKCYQQKGDFRLALTHLNYSNTYRDSVFSDLKTKEILKLNTKYQTSQKQAENKRLLAEQKLKEATIAQQKSYLIAGTIGLGLLLLLSFLLYRQNTKRKLANIKLALQKDQIQLLNRELNHRVKNNLAFMTSLLEMQGRRTKTAEAKQVLLESEARLKALSLVHSNLFKNNHDTEINLANYLTEIISHLQDIFELPNKTLHINQSFVDYTIDAEDAMRIGLIINELVTNSLKHAFGSIDNPTINIETSLSEMGKLSLKYSDNGPGIINEILVKGEGDDKEETSSMGKKLITLLVLQLKGELNNYQNEVVVII